MACWVFLSLIVIEGIVLIPSYQNRKRELLLQLEQVSRELLAAAQQNDTSALDTQQLFRDFQKQNTPDSVIKGAALYSIEGKRLNSFGELPELSSSQVSHQYHVVYLTPDQRRYDVAWGGVNFSDQYILIVRHDSSKVQQELMAYTGRISGVVLLISIVVTGSTMFVVGAMIIVPFLKLRRDFEVAAESISDQLENPEFQTLSLKRDDEMGEVFQGFHQMFQRIHQEVQQRQEAEIALRQEQEKSEKLLFNVLPAAIAAQLKEGERAIAQAFDEATILFADLVNFTCLATEMSANDLVCLLNDIFSRFDRLAEQYHLEKIKTIGDAYMVVSGIPMPRPDHAVAMVEMALAMQAAMEAFNQERNLQFQLRIGINTGPVVAGVIGIHKFAYDLWGDAVNIASRMESHSLPGKIQVTGSTYALLKDRYEFESRGKITVKGRGEMETYFVLSRISS
jgi:class 3 adenylate cyclase